MSNYFRCDECGQFVSYALIVNESTPIVQENQPKNGAGPNNFEQ